MFVLNALQNGRSGSYANGHHDLSAYVSRHSNCLTERRPLYACRSGVFRHSSLW